MTSIRMAATQYTVRQLPTSASAPAAVRASRIPSSSPLMTVPTALPRSWGAASVAAKGTRIWATTDSMPVRAVPTIRAVILVAKAEISSPPADSRLISTIRERRSNMSPSGTSSISPTA
ncbi:hypothetical protein D3C85_1229450 [compost metagenome]